MKDTAARGREPCANETGPAECRLCGIYWYAIAKEDKTTNKFGPIVHAYTMQRAVEDKAVTPLLYEERIPDLEVNDRAIDAWFDRITDGLSEAQKADLKRKYARKGEVYSADDRIRLIALDIATHFSKNIDEG
jgi:type I restriction enzyme R subunit